MTDFGHIDSRGDLQVGGVSPKVAADLRATLVAHLNDFDFESGHAPLSTDEVVAAARGAISGASQRAQKAEADFGLLREDYAALGSQAIDEEDYKRGLMAELSEVRGALETVRKETAAASEAHAEETAGLEAKRKELRDEKSREAHLAEAAELVIDLTMEAAGALKTALAVAEAKTFGGAAARRAALEEFRRATSLAKSRFEEVKRNIEGGRAAAQRLAERKG